MITLEQIEAIEAYNQGDDSRIEHAMDLLDDKGFERPDTIAALCQLARERLTAGTFADGIEVARLHKLGDRVTKMRGSMWTGKVVGFYSTELTPIGYAVESETETGSVQIYPEAAIRALKPEQSNE